jgi:hypothetical protein
MPSGIGTLAPMPKLQLFNSTGTAPAAGYKLFTYVAGSSTKLATYTDNLFAGANANPIILDSAGRATVFLPELSYKFVLALPTDSDPPTSPIWTVDGIQGVPQQAGNTDVAGIAGEILAAGDIVYLGTADGKWHLSTNAAAASSVDAQSIGIVITGAAEDAAIVVRIAGRVVTVGALTLAATYYLTTAGDLVTPTPAAAISRPFGFADTTHSLVFPITETGSAALRTALKMIGFSAGQANAAGAGDTLLNNYSITIPAGYLSQGEALVLDGTFSVVNRATARAAKIKVGGGSLVTLFTTSTAATMVIPFRYVIRRRTSATGSITGVAWIDAASGGAPVNYMINAAAGAVDWTAGQTLAIYAVGTNVDDIVLTDYSVYPLRSYQNALV